MRWKMLIFLLVLTAGAAVFGLYYMDGFAKRQIESIGTSVIGAKVSLDGLNISLLEQSINIRNLQIANPKDPWKNMFELRSASFDFSLKDLLMGSVVIENLSANTPRWDTKRTSWGGVDKKPEPQKEKKEKLVDIDWSKYLPSMEIPRDFDATKFINPEKMESIRTLDNLRKKMEGRDQYWKGRIEEIRKVAEEVRSKPTPENIPHLIELVEAAQKEMQDDVRGVEQGLKSIENLRKTDLKNIHDILDLPDLSTGGLSQKLLAAAYTEQLKSAYATFKEYKSKIDKLSGKKTEEEKKERAKGIDVPFPVLDPKPRFHLKTASLKVDDDKMTGNWFSGTIKDISSNPKLTAKPTVLDLYGGQQDLPGADLSIKGKIDLTKENDYYNLDIKASKISTNFIHNALGGDSPINISGGTVDTGISFTVDGNLMKSGFNVLMKEINLTSQEKSLTHVDPAARNILKSSLEGIHKINVLGNGEGTMDKMTVKITSNMDDILSDVFKRAIKQAEEELRKRLAEELDKEIKKRVPELEGLLTDEQGQLKDFDSISKSLEQRLKDEVNKRLEEEKKKLENRLEEEKKKQEEKLKKEAEKKAGDLFKDIGKKLKLPF